MAAAAAAVTSYPYPHPHWGSPPAAPLVWLAAAAAASSAVPAALPPRPPPPSPPAPPATPASAPATAAEAWSPPPSELRLLPTLRRPPPSSAHRWRLRPTTTNQLNRSHRVCVSVQARGHEVISCTHQTSKVDRPPHLLLQRRAPQCSAAVHPTPTPSPSPPRRPVQQHARCTLWTPRWTPCHPRGGVPGRRTAETVSPRGQEEQRAGGAGDAGPARWVRCRRRRPSRARVSTARVAARRTKRARRWRRAERRTGSPPRG